MELIPRDEWSTHPLARFLTREAYLALRLTGKLRGGARDRRGRYVCSDDDRRRLDAALAQGARPRPLPDRRRYVEALAREAKRPPARPAPPGTVIGDIGVVLRW